MTDQLWQTALDQLESQTTQATYDAWLKNTHQLEAENGSLLIGVRTEAAQQWLQHRLYPTISRAVTQIAGRPLDIKFIVAPHPEPTNPPPLQGGSGGVENPAPPSTSIAHYLAAADYYAAHFKSGGAGYAMLAHYDTTYWMPYLESQVPGCWALYLRLAGQKRATIKNIADRWTDPRRYTYRELAGWLNLSHSRTISGYIFECYQSLQSIRDTGQPLPTCCGRHQPAAVRPDREKRPRCIYWKTGMLEILHNQHLAAIQEQKSSTNRIRAHLLQIQVWRLLPLLTPAQAATLNPDLQHSHIQWLTDFGHLLGLERIGDWEQIDEPSLVPYMTGYQDNRQITGPYRPDSHFQKLLRQTGRRWPNFANATCMSHLETDDD